MHTGRGARRGGEGVMGLTWALTAAGARAQIVSQWAVNDAATATLMTVLYSRLKTDAPATSLRAAALGLQNYKATAHPYFWAPFIVLGD